MVEQFHRTFDLNVADRPTIGTDEIAWRRYQLIREELEEYLTAKDVVGIADAIGDLLYVVLGTAVEHGIDIEPIFNEIHRSNMTKVGGHRNEYGKWVKPDNYEPADLTPIVTRQLRFAYGN